MDTVGFEQTVRVMAVMKVLRVQCRAADPRDGGMRSATALCQWPFLATFLAGLRDV